MLYRALIRPLLFLQDPEKAHERTLALLARLSFLDGAFARFFSFDDPRLAVRVGPLECKNPVGLAAGFDKNGVALRSWPSFGFGFVEIGAVTAAPQPGNPKPRLIRLPKDRALINRLGFNNEGARAIADRLRTLREGGSASRIPLGINIGRTRAVAADRAVADYLVTFALLFRFGDYFTINVSSPNTPGLRELQQKGPLDELLAAVQQRNRELAVEHSVAPKAVFLKIAPDLEFSQVDEIVEIVRRRDLTGIIATNASADLRDRLSVATDEPGGLSGRPLRDRATSFVRYLYQATQGRLAIIGSGGIFTAADAYAKIKAGAVAVQIYTGFVYEGPGAVVRINRGMLELAARDGFRKIADAVGCEDREHAH
jgi:dihydroorotate dehydrogenase